MLICGVVVRAKSLGVSTTGGAATTILTSCSCETVAPLIFRARR
jgi:hypothetical protein